MNEYSTAFGLCQSRGSRSIRTGRVLNSAIIAADVSTGWGEYVEIFDAFYADEIEVTTDAETKAVRGKERIRALLLKFLVRLM